MCVDRRTDTRTESQQHLPDAPRGGLIRTYEEPPPATAPRYHSLTDAMLRKRSVSTQNQNVVIGNYTNNGWSNIPAGVVCGEPPPRKSTNTNKDSPMQWTINEHGLTIYHDKSPSVFRHKEDAIAVSPLAYAPSQGSFLPFFTPSQQVMTPGGLQQKRKQLDISPPPNVPNNLPVSSGFSIDRTIGTRNCTTGATHNTSKLFKDFYSQLVHAAVNLQLTENIKKSSTTQNAKLHRITQNNLNLSPQRQHKRTRSSRTRNSTKSSHSFDSRSTCSSHGSSTTSKRQKSKVKSQHRRLSLLQQDCSATSSQTSLDTTHDVTSRTGSSSENISHFSSGDHGPLRKDVFVDNVSTFRVSLKDHNGKIMAEPDRRLTVCEAVDLVLSNDNRDR
ncbi:uncharacterized protein [Amphiura filiformis]|uniref:uncharacterized protein isoform X2 n=1 Tax=Amphiura filiformis TaxID=82378 RepID=UPI003B2101F3